MNKSEKVQVVNRLIEKINQAKVAVLINFHGLNVEKMNLLRRELKKVSSELVVAKNTLLKRASLGTRFELLNPYFTGPTGVTFGYKDVVAPVKVLTKFQKDSAELGIKAALLGTKVLNTEEIMELSNLPSREVLLSRLLYLLKSAPTNFVNILTAAPLGLIFILNELKRRKETPS